MEVKKLTTKEFGDLAQLCFGGNHKKEIIKNTKKMEENKNEKLSFPNAIGMTLRDYFANSAMMASFSNPELLEVVSVKEIKDGSAYDAVAISSYNIADAMLKQREL